MNILLQRIADSIRAIEANQYDSVALIIDEDTKGIDVSEFLSSCSNDGTRSLSKGQVDDCRFPLHDGSLASLHMYKMQNGSAEFHLDSIDPKYSNMLHLIHDTVIAESGFAGSVIGSLWGIKGALMGTAIGAWLGAKITGSSRDRWWVEDVETMIVSKRKVDWVILRKGWGK